VKRFLKVGWLFAIAASLFAQDGTKSIKPVNVGRKVALVIGNSSYQRIPGVPPASADADEMAQTLRNLRFDSVTVKKDLNGDALISEIARFTRAEVQPGDLALVYYSGHGGQVGEENYLLPVDYDPPSDEELVERRAYKMSRVRDALERTNARVRVLIFDACRNSPVTTTKAATSGLRAMDGKPEGTLIAYASAHNQVARYDGSRNSFYTSELLAEMRQPGADLKGIFERVQNRVYERTGHQQTPYLYGFLSGPLYLVGSAAPAPRPEPLPSAPVNRVEAATGTLLVESDADATFTVDVQPGVALKAGQIRQITLSPGGHILQASAGGAQWRKVVEIRAGEQQAVVVELAKDVADAAMRGIEGTWALTWEGDTRLSDAAARRVHMKLSQSLQISRLGDGFTGVWHEERELKGIDDPNAATDNYTQRIDGTFRLRLVGDRLTGVSDSAHQQTAGRAQAEFGAVAFTGTVLGPGRLKVEIVWQRDPLNSSTPTLEKRQ
jgi:uncharacterized caspase-like protein